MTEFFRSELNPNSPDGVLDRIMEEFYNDPDQDFLSGILVTYPG